MLTLHELILHFRRNMHSIECILKCNWTVSVFANAEFKGEKCAIKGRIRVQK